MLRVAILADVHGNLPALRAVLDDIASQEVDEVLVGGDLVGRGPGGSAAVAAIAATGWPSVRGNHEDYLLTFRRGQVPGSWLTSEDWTAVRWMAAELDTEALSYIGGLPLSVRSRVAPEIRLVHGTPASNNDGIGPWSSRPQIAAHLDAIDEPVLVCCHTHRPLLERFDSGSVVNVGSVGLPFNRNPRAQYAILTSSSHTPEVEFRQVEYDRSELLRIYESSGFRAAGGVTARLLELEIEHAAPYLVPFMHWATITGNPRRTSALSSFLDDYDHAESMRDFFARVQAASAT